MCCVVGGKRLEWYFKAVLQGLFYFYFSVLSYYCIVTFYLFTDMKIKNVNEKVLEPGTV